MSERLRRAIHEAERGDLRPQFNPNAAVNWQTLPGDAKEIEKVLIDRFLELARPIADSSRGAGPEARLQDAGPFFYLVETLKRLGFDRLPETLRVLLDEFSQLEESAYDELYLWSIVELSRTDPAHVDTYWPQVLTLDLHYRAEPWERPEGVHLVDQPYRLTDLLFYYYVIYALKIPSPPSTPYDWHRESPKPEAPSLGSHLRRIAPSLTAEQLEMARRALRELADAERNRPAFGDARGLILPPKPPGAWVSWNVADPGA
jgi:hypothetical protein